MSKLTDEQIAAIRDGCEGVPAFRWQHTHVSPDTIHALATELLERRATEAAKDAEIERLTREARDADVYWAKLSLAYNAVPCQFILDPPDGGDVPLNEGIRRLDAARISAEAQRDEALAKVARLREALEPFAKAAEYLDAHNPDAPDTDEMSAAIGDFRRARAALEDKP
jgi:hypothetical protein